MSSKLFTFNRSLPAPFDKVAKKVKVSSTYGDGTEATLSSTVVKAVLAYCACMDGSKPGAVGLCGQKGVAEYKSASGPDAYHLAVYDPCWSRTALSHCPLARSSGGTLMPWWS